MKIINRVNKLAIDIEKELGKKIKAIRVFTNCLCLYFDNGGTRFYSKLNEKWGRVGSVYFVTKDFKREALPKSLKRDFKSLVEWTQYWVDGTANKLWLRLEYNIKHKV